MAESDDVTHCPVCFEAYTEKGHHIPRLLPCTHTVCEKCIAKLLSCKQLVCPECRVKHAAANGEKTFSQNKYIITFMKRKPKGKEKNKEKIAKEKNIRKWLKKNGVKEEKKEEKMKCSEDAEVYKELKADPEDNNNSKASVHTKVLKTIETGFTSILCITPSSGGRVVVCGVEGDRWRLSECSLEDGTEGEGTVLEEKPEGMTQVLLDGKPCIAVSYGYQQIHYTLPSCRMGKRIEFRDSADLNRVMESYSVHHLPSRLCTLTSDPATLLYVDYLKTPRKIRWLDCRKSPPEIPEVGNVTETKHSATNDMCCSLVPDSDNRKEVLILTDSEHGVCAYDITSTSGDGDDVIHSADDVNSADDITSDKLAWSVSGKSSDSKSEQEIEMSPWGVTSDGLGHVYVCDMFHSCVRKFSAVDGAYIACVIRKGEEGFGTPRCVRWLKEESALLVAHKEGDKRNISVIKVDNDSLQAETP